MRETAMIAMLGMVACATHVMAAPAGLPDMSVTAARYETETTRTAANVTVITSEQIQDSGCLNVVELLRDLAGVQVRSTTGNSALSEISLRGFGENAHGRVLVLKDGRRLNRPDMASINWLQIPMASIERIEVVRGGQSALYGDNAVAGVIHIITREGKEEPSRQISVDAASYDTWSLRADAAGNLGKLRYAISANGYDSNGYRDNSDFESYGGAVSLAYDLAAATSLRLGGSMQATEHGLPGFLSLEQMQADPRQSLNADDRVEGEYLDGNAGVTLAGSGHQLDFDFAVGRRDIESNIGSWFSYSDLTLETYALTPRYRWATSVAGHENTLLVGVDGYLDRLQLDRFASAAHAVKAGDADVEKRSVGGYVRNTFSITENLLLALGARAETAEIDANVSASGAETVNDDDTHSGTAVDASLLYAFENGGKVFVRGNTVYRYPFLDEQVSYYGFGDAFNKDLDAETGWAAELGGVAVLGGGFQAELTAFILTMDDEIAYNNVTFVNDNLDTTRRIGAEAGLGWQGNASSLGLSLSYVEAEFTDGPNDGQTIPLVPDVKASLTGIVALPLSCKLQGTATYVGKSYLGGDNANAGPKLSDYTTVDLYLRHASPLVDGLEVYAGAENLFDEEYASLAYRGFSQDGYYPSPGATFKAGASIRF